MTGTFSRSSSLHDVIQAPFCVFFGTFNSWSYLHNGKGISYSYLSWLRSISVRSISGQKTRAHAYVRASARAQNFKMLKIDLKLILHTFQAILSISCKKTRTRTCARVFARNGIFQHRIAKFSMSSYLTHFFKHFDTLFTFFWPLITEWASV